MMRRTARHVGRIRVRLAELIRAAGWQCEPDDLRPQQGAWRTDHRLDVCRWEGTIRRPEWGPDMHEYVQCWDTMTECVRRGIEITRHERFGWQISARSAPSPEKTDVVEGSEE